MARRISRDADNTQAITTDGRTLLATIVGSATPVHAAIHAARHSGHFGNMTKAVPGKRDAAPLESRWARWREGHLSVQHRSVITRAPRYRNNC